MVLITLYNMIIGLTIIRIMIQIELEMYTP